MVKENAEENINWDAQEYVVRTKNTGWYVALVAVGIALCALGVWLQTITFVVLVVVSVAALIVYSVRPPRTLHYSLSKEGLSEGNKLYRYEDYKSFGILQEEGNFAIVLTPRKRFALLVTVYFPQEEGEKIVDMFGARLPMEEVKMDFLDKIIKILRI